MRSQIIAAIVAASLATMSANRGVGRHQTPDRRHFPRERRAVDVLRTRLQRAAFQPAEADQCQQRRASSASRGSAIFASAAASYEATPVVADGRIFVTCPWSKVYAFDAKTGKQLWKYDPKVPGAWSVKLCCGIVNRGVAVWQGEGHLGNAGWPPDLGRREDG